MKRQFIYSVLFALCLVVLNCKNERDSSTSEVKLVTADEMQRILELEDVQLVDVRTPGEHQDEHIINSQNIDFRSPTFEADIERLDKSKPVILYCRSGARSAKCAEKLKDAGFEKIYDLDGGISKWKHTDKIKIQAKS